MACRPSSAVIRGLGPSGSMDLREAMTRRQAGSPLAAVIMKIRRTGRTTVRDHASGHHLGRGRSGVEPPGVGLAARGDPGRLRSPGGVLHGHWGRHNRVRPGLDGVATAGPLVSPSGARQAGLRHHRGVGRRGPAPTAPAARRPHRLRGDRTGWRTLAQPAAGWITRTTDTCARRTPRALLRALRWPEACGQRRRDRPGLGR